MSDNVMQKPSENLLRELKFKRELSDSQIEQVKDAIKFALDEDNYDDVNDYMNLLIDRLPEQVAVAQAIIEIVEEQLFIVDDNCELLDDVFSEYQDDAHMVCQIGHALEFARNIDDLNEAPSEHPIFKQVIDELMLILDKVEPENERHVLNAFTSAMRMMGRQYDKQLQVYHQRLIALEPNNADNHYNYGLFCKTRGLFEQGMLANQKALELRGERDDATEWNLGICATGMGGETGAQVALDIWLKREQKIAIGRFDLPDGRYPSTKVKLATHPLAERHADNDYPGQQETIWIERLSPCHGIVRSVLYYDLGVDYGDVILHDGAPITYHKYGDDSIPVFPHLATIKHMNYQFYDFAAIQNEKGQVNQLDKDFDDEAVIYVHTENVNIICSTCFNDAQLDREVKPASDNVQVVTGRIAAPPDMSAQSLLVQVTQALVNSECELYSPSLCEAAEDSDKAFEHQQKYDLLLSEYDEHHH